ncbi:hypothetical protein [Aureliella helgolandensis]|uniref:Uncharacterized protein n=1 Tax=Aureliella helgolandensis TaxID=2527968 RepID=A0A518G506_9BACT|nr:hypothetical protein [Aureliella helgolandensis]QDV23662.1 hypothetical protein Q31a_19670 [Aureliella helgolandensis]
MQKAARWATARLAIAYRYLSSAGWFRAGKNFVDFRSHRAPGFFDNSESTQQFDPEKSMLQACYRQLPYA